MNVRERYRAGGATPKSRPDWYHVRNVEKVNFLANTVIYHLLVLFRASIITHNGSRYRL